MKCPAVRLFAVEIYLDPVLADAPRLLLWVRRAEQDFAAPGVDRLLADDQIAAVLARANLYPAHLHFAVVGRVSSGAFASTTSR